MIFSTKINHTNKIKYLLTSMAVAGVLVAPTAYSAPGGEGGVTHFLTRSASVSGYAQDGNIYYYFGGQSYDDLHGVAQGYVYSERYDTNNGTNSYINCSGPAYANAVSVSGGGRSTVDATLDPANTNDCYSWNVPEKIMITVDGQADGNYANSNNGNGKTTAGGITHKYNSKYDEWSETFSAHNGFYQGTFAGGASINQYNNRTKEK
jgi:hypothetical protein